MIYCDPCSLHGLDFLRAGDDPRDDADGHCGLDIVRQLGTLHRQFRERDLAAELAVVVDRVDWLKFFHELGHALVCHRYGGNIRETGVVIAFFAPLAYVDASSCWSFRSRWHRIHTALAGVYVELIIASLSILAWKWCDSVVLRHVLQNTIIMASVSTLLFNLNPLMKFDGYYVLSDLLQIPNLSTQANSVITELARRIFFGDSGSRPTVIGQQRWVLLAYGAAAMVWRLLVTFSLLIMASVLFHGAGSRWPQPAFVSGLAALCGDF
jgi:hypothetical protein